jgi:hypothetical protein
MNPPVMVRGIFINEIFAGNKDIKIQINDKCTNFINDLIFQKEASDGGKEKKKITRNGSTFEEYGHLSDCFDYFLCRCFEQDFAKMKRGGRGGLNDYVLGKKPFNSAHSY